MSPVSSCAGWSSVSPNPGRSLSNSLALFPVFSLRFLCERALGSARFWVLPHCCGVALFSLPGRTVHVWNREPVPTPSPPSCFSLCIFMAETKEEPISSLTLVSNLQQKKKKKQGKIFKELLNNYSSDFLCNPSPKYKT